MKNEHTLVSWTTGRAINVVDTGKYSWICPFGASSKKQIEEITAIAKIIAASPDLLAALEAMVSKIDDKSLPISCSAARAAIAKARGE